MRKKTEAATANSEQHDPALSVLVRHTTAIVSSYVEHNRLNPSEIPAMISSVHAELNRLRSGAPILSDAKPPAVSIKRSIGDDFIICLEDGKRLTMLKRYLKTHHNMTPDDYRRKWGLPIDYPMVAPAYARLRSSFAKKIGLGRVNPQRKRR